MDLKTELRTTGTIKNGGLGSTRGGGRMVDFPEDFRTVLGPSMYEFAEKNGAIASFVGCAEKAVKIRVFGAGWRFPEVFHDFGGERGGGGCPKTPYKQGSGQMDFFSDVFERLWRPKKGHFSREKPEKRFFPSNICICVFFSKKTPKRGVANVGRHGKKCEICAGVWGRFFQKRKKV